MSRENKDPTIENRQLFRWIVCALIACGVVLRLIQLGRNGLIFNEISYISACKGDPNHIFSWNSVLAIYASPLFYHIGRFCLQNAHSVLCIRLLPALFGMLTLPLVYSISRCIMSRGAAIACLSLVTFSPYHIYISQRFLPHSMLILFFIANLYCFFQITRRGINRYLLAGFILSGICCLSTNIYMIILCLSQFVYLRLSPPKKNCFLLRYWWKCWVAIIPIVLLIVVLAIFSFDYSSPSQLIQDRLTFLWQFFLMIYIVPYSILIENKWAVLFCMLLNLLSLVYIYKGIMSIKITHAFAVCFKIDSSLVLYCTILLILQLILPVVLYSIAPLGYISEFHISALYIPVTLLMTRGVMQLNSTLLRWGSIACFAVMIICGILNYYCIHIIDEQYYILSDFNNINSLP